MLIHRFDNGDIVERRNSSLIAVFAGKRKVLSTAPLNGGMREDLTAVFNHCAEREKHSMRGSSYKEHISLLAEELQLNPFKCCGISTGAYAENAAVCQKRYRDTEVTAVVTAGIDVNGSRVGETACWHEADSGYIHTAGTINIMLFINNDLSEGAMTRALITCTEAKTAAVSELAVPSCYSSGLATGSGTDGAILICNPASSIKLTEAGNHFKLGELIGQAVITAVKQALEQETGLNTTRQFNFFRRIGRYGISLDDLTIIAKSRPQETRDDQSLRELILQFTNQDEIIILSILIADILDQLSYGAIESELALSTISRLITITCPKSYNLSSSSVVNSKEEAINQIINLFTEAIIDSI